MGIERTGEAVSLHLQQTDFNFKRPTSISKDRLQFHQGDSQTDQFQLIKHMYTHTLVSRSQNAFTSDLATQDHTYVCTHSSTDSDTTHTVQPQPPKSTQDDNVTLTVNTPGPPHWDWLGHAEQNRNTHKLLSMVWLSSMSTTSFAFMSSSGGHKDAT